MQCEHGTNIKIDGLGCGASDLLPYFSLDDVGFQFKSLSMSEEHNNMVALSFQYLLRILNVPGKDYSSPRFLLPGTGYK